MFRRNSRTAGMVAASADRLSLPEDMIVVFESPRSLETWIRTDGSFARLFSWLDRTMIGGTAVLAGEMEHTL